MDPNSKLPTNHPTQFFENIFMIRKMLAFGEPSVKRGAIVDSSLLLLLQQNRKPCLLVVVICRQGVGQSVLAHDDEGDAVG